MKTQLIYRSKKVWHFFKTFLLGALPANIYYRFPSRELKVVVITGTDGKTTSSTLMYHVLKTAGKKVALISTVAAYIGDEAIDTGFHVTNPTPWQLQTLLRRIADKKFEYVVLEMTSHGIYQFRSWGIRPNIAGLTNISHEHLDYHVTYENYVKAKSVKLQQAELAIINKDDRSYDQVSQLLKETDTKFLTYSSNSSLPNTIQKAVDTRFPEPYNQMNTRLVYTIAKQCHISDEEFTHAITSFPGIPGRMQKVEHPDFNIIVDFAHTPEALKQALIALRKQMKPSSRLFAVYGCAGLRDVTKRPLMGKIGVELADRVVFTAEDPRIEDVWSIIRQMKEQIPSQHHKLHSIPDRYSAIHFAFTHLAKKGDTIAVLGKGHEQSMCFGTTEYPWNDIEAIQDIVQKLGK